MRRKTFFKIIVLLFLVALGAVIYLFVLKDRIALLPAVAKPWHAVYLNSNQIYFGHISKIEDGTMHLTDVYTLQSFQEPAETSTSENFALRGEPKQTYKLVKKGIDKIITTDNAMTINLNSVVYWEKLTAGSEVMKLLESVK